MYRTLKALGVATALSAGWVAAPSLAQTATRASAPESVEDLQNLSIDELANLTVSSVSKRPETLSEVPAAIYVITGEDIRRSGANSLPEALRLAPNLEVLYNFVAIIAWEDTLDVDNDPIDPIEVIASVMLDEEKTQADLARLFKSESRASEIMNKRRRLTVQMVYLLNREWNIPAELLIQPYELATSPRAA